MAVSFIEQKETKRQKILFVILGVLVVVFIFILGQGFIKKFISESISRMTIIPVLRKPDIDFSILEGKALKDLEPFEGIKPFEGKIGREDPFVRY